MADRTPQPRTGKSIKYQPRRLARYYYLRFLRLKGDPGSIARGVALGLYIGVTPTIPLHTILIISLSLPLRANAIAGVMAAAVISNPLTFFQQYYFSWLIGAWLLPGDLSWDRVKTLTDAIGQNTPFAETMKLIGQLGFETVSTLVAGGCILALPFAVAGYFFTLRFFQKVREKRREKHVLN